MQFIKTNDLNTVFQTWPRYSDPAGYQLVSNYIVVVLFRKKFILNFFYIMQIDIDFFQTYGSKSELLMAKFDKFLINLPLAAGDIFDKLNKSDFEKFKHCETNKSKL